MDEERIKAEELYDGKFILQSNTNFDWKDIILSYKTLWRVEACFKALKSEFEVGPIYHYSERRIRAHIFICFLALLLKVVFQKSLADTDGSVSASKVLKDIRKIKAVQIKLKDKPVILRTELEGDAHHAFKAIGLKIPPRVLTGSSDIQQSVVVRL